MTTAVFLALTNSIKHTLNATSKSNAHLLIKETQIGIKFGICQIRRLNQTLSLDVRASSYLIMERGGVDGPPFWVLVYWGTVM